MWTVIVMRCTGVQEVIASQWASFNEVKKFANFMLREDTVRNVTVCVQIWNTSEGDNE